MKTILANKGILALIAFFILAMFIYNLFFKPEASSVPSELDASSIGNDLLKMHEDLKKVTFDQALFSSPGYLLLNDFSVAIPEQAVGRPNPFNSIGRD